MRSLQTPGPGQARCNQDRVDGGCGSAGTPKPKALHTCTFSPAPRRADLQDKLGAEGQQEKRQEEQEEEAATSCNTSVIPNIPTQCHDFSIPAAHASPMLPLCTQQDFERENFWAGEHVAAEKLDGLVMLVATMRTPQLRLGFRNLSLTFMAADQGCPERQQPCGEGSTSRT